MIGIKGLKNSLVKACKTLIINTNHNQKHKVHNFAVHKVVNFSEKLYFCGVVAYLDV